MIVLIRGGGEVASGVALRLHRAGFRVAISELEKPLAKCRMVSFADAVFRIDTNNTLGVVNFKPKVNIISINLGGKWAFMPKGKVNPFVAASVAANFFGGKFEFGQDVKVKGKMRTAPMDMKSETRIGFIFDTGIDFMLSKQVGAVIGVKYHMINPLGKGADDPTEVGDNEIDLGDVAHTEDGNTFPDRNISSINGYVGVSFYFGAPKTVKK